MNAVAAVGIRLAQAPPGTPGAGRGEEFGKASPIALVVVLLLGLATVLLIRSMNKRLRNVPAEFDRPETGADATDGADGTDGTDGSADSDDSAGAGGTDDDAERASERSPTGGTPPGRSERAPGTGSP